MEKTKKRPVRQGGSGFASKGSGTTRGRWARLTVATWIAGLALASYELRSLQIHLVGSDKPSPATNPLHVVPQVLADDVGSLLDLRAQSDGDRTKALDPLMDKGALDPNGIR
jgi:hypothetical protein